MHPPSADPSRPRFPGGRKEALRRLAAIDPARYGSTRNHLDGAVTRLSPYLRHGVLTLGDVRDAVFRWLDQTGHGATPERRAEGRRIAGKLINELGWRDHWQRLWQRLGDGIWQDLEPLKTGHAPGRYSPELPDEVREASTGLACIDGFATELQTTGWLHNHARMWLASYLVHWRQVRWQTGAAWFLQHLLDGDPASNNLSWQWVASSFSNKPYIFNRANLERFSASRYCRRCPAAGACPFEASYEALQEQLFRTEPTTDRPPAPEASALSAIRASAPQPTSPTASPAPRQPLLWIHHEGLGPTNPALRAHPDRPALVLLDASGGGDLSGGLPLSPLQRTFLSACAAGLPIPERKEAQQRGVAAAGELLALARRHGADAIVSSRSVDPRLQAIAAELERLQQQDPPAARVPLQLLDPDPFVVLEEPVDLRRFSRYWRRAEAKVWAGWGQAWRDPAHP